SRSHRRAREHPFARRAGTRPFRVRLADVRALAGEARGLGFAVRDGVSVVRAGPIVVSGVLAEQLAKELGAGAEPGAVRVGSGRSEPSASVLVHVIAGDPNPEDEALV